MNELIKNYVVQSNELIQKGNWHFTKVQLDLFKIFVSLIDTENPTNKLEITKQENNKLKTKTIYLKDTLGIYETEKMAFNMFKKLADDNKAEIRYLS